VAITAIEKNMRCYVDTGSNAQRITLDIRGHVTDTAGNLLAGASVAVNGTKRAITPDGK
jgi:protocatechuate 3,4-dioxygenase beta subunit